MGITFDQTTSETITDIGTVTTHSSPVANDLILAKRDSDSQGVGIPFSAFSAGGGSVEIKDDGSQVVSAATSINAGDGISVTNDGGGAVTLNASGAVSSVFGRTGDVVAASSPTYDYSGSIIAETAQGALTSTTVHGQLGELDSRATTNANSISTTNSNVSSLQTTVNAATDAATASVLVKRDASSRFKAADPSAATDVVTKQYADALGTTAATASTIARRDSNGNISAAAATASGHAVIKSQLDAIQPGWVYKAVNSVNSTNTTSEQTIASITVPANTLAQDGDALYFYIHGKYTNNSGVNRDIAFRIKQSSTTILGDDLPGIATQANPRVYTATGTIWRQSSTTCRIVCRIDLTETAGSLAYGGSGPAGLELNPYFDGRLMTDSDGYTLSSTGWNVDQNFTFTVASSFAASTITITADIFHIFLNGAGSSATGGAVSSVFGRTGAVASVAGDYTAAQITTSAISNTPVQGTDAATQISQLAASLYAPLTPQSSGGTLAGDAIRYTGTAAVTLRARSTCPVQLVKNAGASTITVNAPSGDNFITGASNTVAAGTYKVFMAIYGTVQWDSL